MSVVRVAVPGLAAGRVELDSRAAHYIAHVHRLRLGNTFIAFDPQQRVEADATIVSMHRARVWCEMTNVRAAVAVAHRPLWLLAGLTKNEGFDRTVRDATALGVTDLVPVLCERTPVPAPREASRRIERWRRIMVDAARQCGRGDVPRIHQPQPLAHAVHACPADALKICLWERAERSARQLVCGGIDAAAVALLVGPEGGWADAEVRIIDEAGFAPVRLGQLVLRAETATVAGLGLVRGLW